MTNYNPRNERIKREYFRLLKQADQMSDATIEGVRRALLRFEESTGFADFSTFDSDQAISFKTALSKTKAERSGKALTPATVLSTLRTIQTFFRWLAREPGYKSKIKANDIRYLNMSRKDVAIATSSGPKRVPTLEQIRAVIAAMPADTEIGMRNRALIAFTIVTGMRDSAIASLRLKHIDVHQQLVSQDPAEVNTKFSKRIETFFAPVGDDLKQLVIDWVRYLREVKLYGNDDPVFPRTLCVLGPDLCFKADGLEPVAWSSAGPIRIIFKEAFEAAGIPYFPPHSFRSTLAILAEKCSRNGEEMQAWAQNFGHTNALTTFTSYGRISLHRQGEIIRNAGTSDKKADRLNVVYDYIMRTSAPE